MIGFRPIAIAVLAVLPAATAAFAQPAQKSRGGFKHEPMIFFVAKGAADACGPGCDTWIAAEGTFDPDVHERLSAFLNAPARRGLPIFFHSPPNFLCDVKTFFLEVFQ